MSDVLVAKESFWFDDQDGTPQLVQKGYRYRAGHPVTVGRTEFFEEDKSVREFEAEAPKRVAGRPRKSE